MNELKQDRIFILKQLSDIDEKIKKFKISCKHINVTNVREFDGHKYHTYYQCTDCDSYLDK